MLNNPFEPNGMRIAVLSLHSCPMGDLGARDTGGMSVYIREMAAGLARRGFQLDIFTRRHNIHDREITYLFPGARLVHLEVGNPLGISHKMSLYPQLNAFTGAIQAFTQRNTISYDLVFSHYWLSGIAGQRLAGEWQVPHVVMFHTLAGIKNGLGVGEAEPVLRLEGETEVARNCQCIIAATQYEKQSLVKLYSANPEIISVIPCGVNLALFKPFEDTESIKPEPAAKHPGRILYVGRIEPLKGLEVLMDALAQLPGRLRWQCLVVGGGQSSRQQIDRLKEQACESGIGGRVVFTGLVPQEKLPGFYNRADCLVVPSFYESFGLVALEAMACGCPVVATDVGDLRNIILPGVSGDTVHRGDAAAMASKIREWLERSPRNRDSKKAIRRSIEGYSWDIIAGRLAADFEKLIYSRVNVVGDGCPTG